MREGKEKSGNMTVSRAAANPCVSVPEAQISWGSDGVPVAEQWCDRYFSADGAVEESTAVFLAQSRLEARWAGANCFVVGELGFGSGLNFFLTWERWRRTRSPGAVLHYLSCECAPMAPNAMRRVASGWPLLLPMVEELLTRLPLRLAGIHRVALSDNVFLTLLLGDARELLPKLIASVDAWFLDGFAPAKNPEMWTDELIAAVAELSHAETTVASYSVAGEIRRSLERYGCDVERRPGFGRKAQMLFGEFTGRPKRVAPPRPQRAAVIGGGLGGSAVARALARRGFAVDLFERGAALAGGASGNDAGIVMPHLAFPREVMSRWYRAGYLAAIGHWAELEQLGVSLRGSRGGVVRMASSDRLLRFFHALEQAGGDGEYLKALSADELSQRAGCALATGGFFLPSGGWMCPPDLCRAQLAAAGNGVQVRLSSGCIALERAAESWILRGDGGQTFGDYPIVVLALGADLLELPQVRWLPLERVRGQIAVAPAASGPPLRCVVCYDGYLIPVSDEAHLIGATYDHHREELAPSTADTEQLLLRARRWIGSAADYRANDVRSRVSFRMMSRDRLPLIGPVPDIDRLAAWSQPYRTDAELEAMILPNLYCSAGHGSRGLISCQLAAELLASQICGEPFPLERDLVRAVDPMRFAIRKARRGELLNAQTLSAQSTASVSPKL